MPDATPKYEPRRAPDATWRGDTSDQWGNDVSLSADSSGVVWPKNDREQAAADHFDLPVARAVLETLKATAEHDAKTKPKRAKRAKAPTEQPTATEPATEPTTPPEPDNATPSEATPASADGED